MKNIASRHLRAHGQRYCSSAGKKGLKRLRPSNTKKNTENPSTHCCCFGCSCCTSLIRLLLLILSLCHERERESERVRRWRKSLSFCRCSNSSRADNKLRNHKSRGCPHSLSRGILFLEFLRDDNLLKLSAHDALSRMLLVALINWAFS
jgi:hypothetical protein